MRKVTNSREKKQNVIKKVNTMIHLNIAQHNWLSFHSFNSIDGYESLYMTCKFNLND